MNLERFVGSAASGFMGLCLGVTGAALYDSLRYHYSWEPAHGNISFVLDSPKTEDTRVVVNQMEPSWSLYLTMSVAGVVAFGGGYAWAHRARRPAEGALGRQFGVTAQ